MPANINPIEASATHFSNILSGGPIAVPSLQRPFDWHDEQVKDFIYDINRLVGRIKENPGSLAEHLFGTIVLISAENFGRPSMVVDGQQRLTTVTLTLGLLENEMKLLKNEVALREGPQAAAIENTLSGYIAALHNLLWTQVMMGDAVLKFTPSPEIYKTYFDYMTGGNGQVAEEMLQPARALRTMAAKIKDALIRHSDWYENQESVEKIRHLDRVKDALLERLLVVLVSTGSPESGYELFEVLNARGEELSALALIKTWIMAQLALHPEEKSVAEKFRNLSNDDKDKQHAYLEDYFKARIFSDLGPKNAKLNSRRVRQYLFKDPVLQDNEADASNDIKESIISHVNTMSTWAPTWAELDGGSWPYKELDHFGAQRVTALIKTLKHSLPLPLLLQASIHLPPTEFISLVHAIEKTFFRYKTICGRQAGKLDEIYLKFTRILDTNHRLDLTMVKSKLQELLDELAPDNLFTISLYEKLQYDSSSQTSQKIKYFLWMLDLYQANPRPAMLAVDLNSFSIEHVGPQNPEEGVREILEGDVNRIGNLCILTAAENRRLSNHSFSMKLEMIEEMKLNDEIITAKISRRLFDENKEWKSSADPKLNSVDIHENNLFQLALQVFRADSGAI